MANSTHETGVTPPNVALLSRVPFLRDASVEVLENLAENTLERRYAAFEPISQQEEFAHSMFIVVSGRVSLHAVRSNGLKIPLGTLTLPGEFFGEEVLLGRGIRLATAIADTDTVLLEVEQRKFALLARKTQGAAEALEHTYHQRAISTFVLMHPYLSQLAPQLVSRLIHGATMVTYQKDEFPVRQGDAANQVMLIADGVLKALRKADDGRLSVLAYFNSGDIVGSHDPPQRPYNLTALGKAEIIFIPKAAFDELEFSAPEIYARFGKDRMSRTGIMQNAGQTIFGSAEALFQEGMEVESLLIIDLDRCVRCGNCVRACHTRHSYTRLDRRGPIFRRRKSLESKEHEHLLIPSSCRHCRDPECMIGCPTGAIARHPNGEVEINENCVGCDNCARKCTYGNITMRPIPVAEQRDGIVKQAIKCNLCRGHRYSNCVHECPRGALLRVNPLEHFDELALVLAADQDREGGQGLSTRRKLPKRSRRPTTALVISALILIICSGSITAAHLWKGSSYLSSSSLGIAFGIIGASCILFALLLGARKKLSNHGLGRLESWTQLHMTFGGIGFVASLAHADYTVAGIGTTLLMLLFSVEIITGIAGQALYSVVPKILTHIEKTGTSKLIEDLYDEQNEIHQGLEQILTKQPSMVRNLAPSLKKLAGSPRRRYSKKFNAPQHVASLIADLQLPAELQNHRATIERVLSDYCKLADTVAQIRLHRVLKQWLFVHIATSAALVTVLLLHITTMLPIIW